MQNVTLLKRVGLAFVVVAALATFGIHKMDVPQPVLQPIESFPRQIGDWKVVEDKKPDADLQKRLPTAHLLWRIYENPVGEKLDFLLVTASDPDDIHQTTVCLPAQGWNLTQQRKEIVAGFPVDAVNAAQSNGSIDVYYWLTAYHIPDPPKNAFLRKLYDARVALSRDEGASLLVRVIGVSEPGSREMITRFAEEAVNPLNRMMAANGTRPQKYAPLVHEAMASR